MKTTELKKLDNSLDFEKIRRMSLEEQTKALGKLTGKQFKEYVDSLPLNESHYPVRAIPSSVPMEEDGVDAIEFLNKITIVR